MIDERKSRKLKSEEFRKSVGSKEQRKMRAEQKGPIGAWSAFGSMGSVGWLIALPTVLGSLLGVWMDHRWSTKINWTLTMLGAGLFFGCMCAGIWMNREKNRIIREREEWEKQDLKKQGELDDAGE